MLRNAPLNRRHCVLHTCGVELAARPSVQAVAKQKRLVCGRMQPSGVSHLRTISHSLSSKHPETESVTLTQTSRRTGKNRRKERKKEEEETPPETTDVELRRLSEEAAV